MRIVIVCNDTLGGVRPYAALAIGLRRAGHQVTAVAPEAHANLFAAAGIPVEALAGTTAAELTAAATIGEQGTLAAMRFMARDLPDRLSEWTRQILAASEGADVLTGGVGGMIVGMSVAEVLGIPFTEAHLQPIYVRTAEFPGVLLPWLPRWLGPTVRRASHLVSDAMMSLPFRQSIRHARRGVLKLHGPARRFGSTQTLYGFSKSVLDVPVSPSRPSLVTGYWELEEEDPPPFADEVESWLDAGERTVAIGFGSMTTSDVAATLGLLDEAMSLVGARAVVSGISSDACPVPASERLLLIPPVPHRWLFPLVNCVVHHGGAGTTGSAFRAGRPQIVVPFAVDQPFWARRTVSLGVSPGFIPRRALSASRLAALLRRAFTKDDLRLAARDLGAQIKTEDGVARAVEAFGAPLS